MLYVDFFIFQLYFLPTFHPANLWPTEKLLVSLHQSLCQLQVNILAIHAIFAVYGPNQTCFFDISQASLSSLDLLTGQCQADLYKINRQSPGGAARNSNHSTSPWYEIKESGRHSHLWGDRVSFRLGNRCQGETARLR